MQGRLHDRGRGRGRAGGDQGQQRDAGVAVEDLQRRLDQMRANQEGTNAEVTAEDIAEVLADRL